MSAKGSRRSAGINLTTAQRHEEPSAACHEELPPLRSSAAHGASSSQSSPTPTIRAAQVASPAAAALVAFQGSTHTKPYLRGHKPSSLNSVSFSDFPQVEIYKPRLQEGLINVSQTLAILPKAAPRPWRRAAPQRHACDNGPTPPAALSNCLISKCAMDCRHSPKRSAKTKHLTRTRSAFVLSKATAPPSEPRRDWTVMRD